MVSAIAAAGATITGSALCVWTSALTNDSLLKGDGNTLYRVNYSSPTALTLVQPSTWIDDAQSADSYKLMFDRFALASDFSHMCLDDKDDPEVVYWYNNGNRQFLSPNDNGEYEGKFQFIARTPSDYTVKWVSGSPYLYIFPCDDDARGIFYEYIPLINNMTEYVTGTATCANAATAVTGTSTDWDGYLSTTYDFYLRFDGDGVGSDSKWYKISTYTGDDSITLASAYGGATKTAQPYTISRVSLYPAKYDTALVYGAALRMDPNNNDAARWASVYGMYLPAFKGRLNTIIGERSRGKK